MKHLKQFMSLKKNVKYEFTLDGDKYQVEFIKLDNIWELLYYVLDEDKWSVSKLTSKGNQFKIIEIVFGKYLIDFINNHKPKEIIIEGLSKNKENNYVSQRTKAYLRFLRKNTPNGWDISPKGDPINNIIKLKYIGNET